MVSHINETIEIDGSMVMNDDDGSGPHLLPDNAAKHVQNVTPGLNTI